MIDIGLGNKVVIIDPLDAAVQELDILFNTTPTELIGNPNYGMNFFQFLWQTTPSTSTLEKYINDKISLEEFLEWYRNPAHYRPELPSTNRSHKYE